MSAVRYDDYELEQISLLAPGDTEFRLWYRVRLVKPHGKYAVCTVLTAKEIAPAIVLYEHSGVVTEP
jgi:hypothetical protein